MTFRLPTPVRSITSRTRTGGPTAAGAPRRLALAATLLLVTGTAVVGGGSTPAFSADPPCTSNAIACENSKAGNPASEWDVSGSGSSSIQGFATDISANVTATTGATVSFKVKTPAKGYRLDVYRLGYYGGSGARKITSLLPSAALPQTQPACRSDASTGLVDCGNWAVSATWAIPAGSVSGLYVAKLVRTDGTSGASHIPFVVRDDSSHSALLFQTSDTTWQAYNQYGGNSLYVGSPAGRAYKVSYNRPITTRGTSAEDYLFNSEYPMLRFLEANGYDVSYTTGVDTAREAPAVIQQHKAFLSVGHDEYWSGGQRANVEAARDAGVSLAFFSGNESFWKTRWEKSIDASATDYRTLVCYKETKADAKIDPADPPTWTGTWRDARFSPPADGGRPENAMSGTAFMVNGGRHDTITVPQADGRMRFWRNTSIASLAPGATATLASQSLGQEWDEDLDNGSRPAGLFDLSTTTLQITGDLLLDNGYTYGDGVATHHLTTYRAASGALVFAAGTYQWTWGLDATHDFAGTAVDARMQQATVNLFADMGAQPATLMAGLTPATASTDTTGPVSNVASPAAGATVAAGSTVTVSGAATDTGGRVAGVEVSVDGGATWHPAVGRDTWSYSWTPTAGGSVTLRSRAVDDSANLEVPGPGVGVTVSPPVCPCTIFGNRVPSSPSDSDPSATELGVKFRADTAGVVSGIRFYKGAGNTGTHTGSLWSSTGTLLATVTFSGESQSGWQQATFASPVAVSAGTTYVASYYAPAGHYAEDDGAFATSGFTSGSLTALRDGADGPNSVYHAGAGFPASTYLSSNYYVDVLYSPGSGGGGDTTPPSVTGRSPAPGATGVPVGTSVSATFSEPVQPATVGLTISGAGGPVATGAVTTDAGGTTATVTPSAPLSAGATYTATVSGAQDLSGNAMTAPVTWTFTTAAATGSTCPCSLWPTTTTPAGTDPDTASVEVGVKVQSSQAGSITAVRFYKAAANTGVHTVHVWSAAGTLLATATASGESASGWQTVALASPVAVTAGSTYVVSYRATVGRYSVNENYFATARTSGPLTAPASTASGGNGVYTYAAPGAFPSSTYAASNYWVDVVFS